jgi:hypothetical protein
MKNLTKVLVAVVLITFSMQSFAQKFGIQGGVNLSKLLMKDDEDTYSDDFDNNLGFNAGATFTLGLTNLIDLEIGAIAESKGFKIEDGGDSWKVNLIYADIPVLLRVGPTFGPVKVFGAVGPYMGIGITGKSKMEVGDQSDTQDVKWGSDAENDDFKRMDFGGKFGVGAEAMGLTFGFYYSLGLANISPYTDGGAKIGTRTMSITVGYKF